MRVSAEKEIKTFKAALRKSGGDNAAMRGLAYAYVRTGDWQSGLTAFSKVGIKVAVFELNPVAANGCNALKAADFWWNFKAKDVAPYRCPRRRTLSQGRQ